MVSEICFGSINWIRSELCFKKYLSLRLNKKRSSWMGLAEGFFATSGIGNRAKSCKYGLRNLCWWGRGKSVQPRNLWHSWGTLSSHSKHTSTPWDFISFTLPFFFPTSALSALVSTSLNCPLKTSSFFDPLPRTKLLSCLWVWQNKYGEQKILLLHWLR